ncbi:3-hydroxy-3-methylglutaryl-coenzyme A reductase [Colletotrichum orbiculare MAFF 240422]|uniref:3-hydroxy-3-methylglutaryl coenzyme A reductase n=1 Tax=Colletotrichum orbiculare (strain 104-T / ATCC 96160 / CBS 514.97 / LARS 414 / MAFF 240422) TaxID=1213857 RepID=N4VBA3_COLOR|nr:3-hydroxy-3-methylglutaryl-coenzyme A reductase [Colletotrichum orbiculare MAFF 240422]
MISSTLLPHRFRGEQPASQAAAPSWLNKKITPALKFLSKVACSHPIHTVVIVAVLASTSYVGLLQESLFDATISVRTADWSSLTEGSRRLQAGPETAWKWQNVEPEAAVAGDIDHLALLTLVFPESQSPESANTAPRTHAVPIPKNLSITSLPSTSNSLTSYSQDSALAFSVPYSQASEFLSVAQEIPDASAEEAQETAHGKEKKMWIMKAAKVHTRNSLVQWIRNGWTEFIDLLKNAEALDIFIMVLGYLSMHLTFVSLFLSMRRMGSNFWLFTNVLFSSVFAFLFGLLVTTKLGVPITMVLLSEGLPFLVVTIGFEKNIVLTRAVLSHAIEHRKPQDKNKDGKNSAKAEISSPNVIQYAVQAAIKEKGYDIVKDYAIEIGILVLGAASGVQGGLQQFCFLAAWILFFDCILLFSFYTAILSIKLEINRIKRHVQMRRALEDDGVSHRVAETVAKSNDWAGFNGKAPKETSLFGKQMKSSNVPKFKVLMVTGFVLINAINICTIPFRNSSSLPSLSSWTGGLSAVVTAPPVDPFKVASNGLDAILESAKGGERPTLVTILTPIKYELEYPSIHYALPSPSSKSGAQPEDEYDHFENYGVGGRMVGSILKSLEDPVLSKWIVVALAMSVALNGYLFNAARWGIKDPNVPDHQIDRKELARAETFNDTDSATLPLGEYIPPTPKPATPASTDDESESLAMTKANPTEPAEKRTIAQLEKMIAEKRVHEMTDNEVVGMSLRGKIPGYSLERALKDHTRAVKIRRSIISRTNATSDLTGSLERSKLPYHHYNWERVFGACCENVIGYMPLPVGVAGPLVIDGQSYFIPMATTEGVLVASTSRGCKAINSGGGAVTVLTADGMTRGPCVGFETLERAGAAKLWLDSDVGQNIMKKAFNSTSNFARLQSMKTALAGTNLYIRFKTTTGDAMGMNMISKGVEHALSVMASEGFEDMNIVSVSGNYCTDKKAAAINWIDGRGKSVVAEAIIPADVVKSVLKSDVDTLVELNINKNLIGSAMAGSVGGFNAHAANIVAAVFLATGQDPAQVVESANCITVMKNLRGSLQISVSMPSLEVGTLGGGTILEPQSAMLDMLGIRGPHPTSPGENSRRLARIIGAAVLAGELSLCSALAAGHLVRAHMQHNRSAPPTRSNTPAPSGTMTPVGLAMTNGAEKASKSSAAAVERARR